MLKLARQQEKAPAVMLSAVHVNFVQDCLEALFNMQFSPPGSGELVGDEKGLILKLNLGAALGDFLNALPFRLIALDATHVRVVISTLAGDIPNGFDPSDIPPFVLSVSGNGVVYAEIAYDASSGAITSRDIKKGASMPGNDATHTRATIGTYTTTGGTLAVLNTAYGPINSNACREFFTPGNPYSIALFAAGVTIVSP